MKGLMGRESLNLTAGAVACGLIAMLGFSTWALIYREVPDANQNALLVLIGILSTNVSTVINFFFGSSSQTKKQADTIDTLAQTARTAGVALSGAAGDAAIVLGPGDVATATATPDGTVINKDTTA